MTKKPAAKTKKTAKPNVKPAAKAASEPKTVSKPTTESVVKKPEPKVVETKPAEPKTAPPSASVSASKPTTAPKPDFAPQAGGSSAAVGAVITVIILGVIGAGASVSRDQWWAHVAPLLPSSGNAQMAARVTAIEDHIAAEKKHGTENGIFAELEQERDKLTAELSAVMARLEAVESSLAGVERMANAVTLGGSSSSKAAQGSIQDLVDRLATLEAGEMNGETDDQLSTVLARLQSVEDQAKAMESAAAHDTATLASVHSKIDAIEARPAVTPASTAGSSAAAQVLGVGQLRDAVRMGSPYKEALEALSAAVAASGGVTNADTFLQTLRDHAASGVPTLLQLQQSFDDVADATFDASEPAGDDGWMAQTLHQLKSIVRIRDTDASVAPGSVESSIARAENNLSAGDLVGAIQVLSGLDGAAADAMAGWLSSAQARLVVEDALTQLHTIAINRMMPSSATG